MKTLLLAAALAGTLGAAAQKPPRPDCRTPEHHQFDFWIGRWTVLDAKGSKQGENSIEPIQNGCALRETWTGAGGGTGTSLSFYDRETKRWHQTWISGGGDPLFLDGAFTGGKMVLTGERPGKDGGRLIHRVTWEPLADGRVRQLWETSADGGKGWTTTFDGYYGKKTG